MPTVQVNEQQLAESRRLLAEIKDGAERALAAALNKTAAKAKTEANKAIRQQIRLSAAYVRERLKGPNDTPANKAFFTRLQAKITAPQRGLLLSHFLHEGASGTLGQKVRVKVKPGGSYQEIKTRPGNIGPSFLVRLRNSGQIGIAQRRRTPGPEGGIIDVLHGPSLSQVLTSKASFGFTAGGQNYGAIDAIGPPMGELLARNLAWEIQRVLARYGGKGPGADPTPGGGE